MAHPGDGLQSRDFVQEVVFGTGDDIDNGIADAKDVELGHGFPKMKRFPAFNGSCRACKVRAAKSRILHAGAFVAIWPA